MINALTTDIKDQDIDFNHDDINNEYIYKIQIDELFNVYKERPVDIFNYNTCSCLLLILSDNTEIPLYKYNPSVNPVFIKIIDPILSGNDIILSVDNKHDMEEKIWQTKTLKIQEKLTVGVSLMSVAGLNIYMPDYTTDYAGHEHCTKLLKYIDKHPDKGEIPAIAYCNSLSKYGYTGYMPAMGQLSFLYKYLNMVNFIFSCLGTESIKLDGTVWSSTESDKQSAYALSSGLPSSINKTSRNVKILPFFKYI